jgi:hypothetical protein
MIDFESAIQSTLIQLNDEHSHTELDPYTFHPSQLAKCPRQCYNSKLGLLDHTDALGTFHTGTTIHEFMENEVIPDLDVETQREVAIEMEMDGLTIIGHADLYEPGTNTVYDYKSRANWYRFNPPIERHLDQIYLYMKALGASQGQIVYLAKSDLEVRTWPPESAGIDAFGPDPGRVQDLLEKGKHIAATIIDEGYPTSKEDIPFKKCDCWLCEKESLRFDHLQMDADSTEACNALGVEGDDTTDFEGTEDDNSGDATCSSGVSQSPADV